MNILIVGYGKVGKIRYKILKKKDFVQKIFIYDPYSKNVKKKGIVLNNLNNIEKLNIKAAFISVPTFLAAKYTKFFLNLNIHVFCEKPPATKIEDLKNIKKIIKKKRNINLMYGFNHRHHNSIKKILEIIKKKKYGKILWIRSRYGKPIDNNYLKGWRGNKRKSGGGILIDQGIHVLDLIILLLGKITKIKSILNNNFIKKNIEDNAFIILENKKKQTASIHSTLTQWRHLFAIEIFFERGFAVLNGLKTPSGKYGQEVLSYCKNSRKPPEIKWEKISVQKFGIDKSFENEINIFLDNLLKKKKILNCNIDEALYLMEIVNKIYKDNKMLN